MNQYLEPTKLRQLLEEVVYLEKARDILIKLNVDLDLHDQMNNYYISYANDIKDPRNKERYLRDYYELQEDFERIVYGSVIDDSE